jgi:hypothetical protein
METNNDISFMTSNQEFFATNNITIEKGDIVQILRPSSYWNKMQGEVAAVEKRKSDTKTFRYPIVVRFSLVNYSGSNTSNFSPDEVVVIQKKKS